MRQMPFPEKKYSSVFKHQDYGPMLKFEKAIYVERELEKRDKQIEEINAENEKIRE